MKKFYKMVSVSPAGEGYAVHLDGKPVKTPSGSFLLAPSQALADEIVKEWAAQKEDVIPETMPLTQILTTMRDHVAAERAAMTEKVLSYLDTDLICYRAEQPEMLAQRQLECWEPWTLWFTTQYRVKLETTTGLGALRQPEDAHRNVAAAVQAMNDREFTVLQMVTVLTGSLVLAMAFVAGAATPEQLYDAANVEENYKFDIYNEAEHGSAPLQEKKQAAMKRDLRAARIFLDLL